MDLVSASAYTPPGGPKRRTPLFPSGWVPGCLLFGIILALLAGVAMGPILPGGIARAPENAALQQSRSIGLLLFSYANDNDGRYPDGNSSTDVFQKLLDERYCSDPSIFYVSLPGKTPVLPGQKLKPENVCFDVTAGVEASAPDGLPLAFMTGYRVTYAPGGAAVPLVKPYPPYWSRTWLGWWQGEPGPPSSFEPVRPGIAVYYENNSCKYLLLDATAKPESLVPNFVSPNFKPDGKTYRQLTPDGVLP